MQITTIDHPVIRVRISQVRSVETSITDFRHAINDIAKLMCYRVCEDLELEETPLRTPIQSAVGHRFARPVIFVPILRAGLGMLQGFTDILTEASVGTIGLYRDEETRQPKSYYNNVPDHLTESEVILIDPMLATGGSAIEAVNQLKEQGATRIRFACLIAAPEGVQAFNDSHPEVPVYTAALDERLNDKAYIVPGLGDAGDRYFGT